MTNLLAIFQAMINKILRDLINKGKVVAFVDDVLVGIEIKEGHNKIVEEVFKKLEKNDLYVKPKKCMWKARRVGFLEVIIEPNGIEMEKEKVEGGTKLARTQKHKRYQKVSGPCKLLQEVY